LLYKIYILNLISDYLVIWINLGAKVIIFLILIFSLFLNTINNDFCQDKFLAHIPLAVPFLLHIGASDNGKALTIPAG